MKSTFKKVTGITAALAMLLSSSSMAFASSHREAPMTAGDPKIDATDLYAFVSPDAPNTVTFIANYRPFEEPAGGPNFYGFDDNALYEIKVDNNGDAKPDISYQFRFKTTVMNPGTFLYNVGPISSLTDPDYNVRQSYTLTKVVNGTATVIAKDVPMPPNNIGPKSTPNYATLQAAAVYTLPAGGKVFAGQVDDPFFVELGGLFDLLTIRKLPGNGGGGVDGLKGYNVHSIVLQVPISDVTANGSKPTDPKDPNAVIGVWTTASRQGTRVLNTDSTQTNTGDWVQVSRLGAPLVNEVVVPLGAKDLWNSSKPENDAQFANGVTDPELGKLLKALYNVQVPPQGPFGSTSARDDLVSIFLTGIPGLTKPANVTPSEELRLNTAIAPSANPNRMGVLGGDNQGYPNGRRLADDVTDISIQAVAGAAYGLFHPGYQADPLATKLGDGVDQNDAPFSNTFPYEALPWDGYSSMPHGAASSPVASGGSTGGTTSGGSTSAGGGTSMTGCTISATLTVGSRGSDTLCLQNYLTSKGYLKGAASGYFGAMTKKAVMDWQKAAGISSTGYFGAMSRDAFNKNNH